MVKSIGMQGGKESVAAADVAAQMRALLRQIFAQALSQATIARAFEKNVEYSRGVLRVCDDLYDLRSFTRVLCIAVGKASRAMAQALTQQIGSGLEGILVEPAAAPASEAAGSTPAPAMLPGFRHFAGGHPVPNRGSLAAARAALQSLRASAGNALVVSLLSGGGSALLEQPLAEEIALEDLITVYRTLVYSGAPIAQINAVRKHLSAVKGGRLALAAHQGGAARQVSIMVSDVPDNTPDALASGITMPDSTTIDDCYNIARQYRLLPEFPPSVRALFETRSLTETPKKDDAAFRNARWWPVLSNRSLQQAAVAAATQAGWAVEVDNSCDDWDYARAAAYLLERVRTLRPQAGRACLIFGGEVTVTIPPGIAPGAGGRNQHFALHCAQQIAGENIAVLSAGSDGIDGSSTATGAVADGATLARARQRNLDIGHALAGFDSATVFQALDDQIVTGPTGNNLRDLRVLLAW